MPRCTSSQSFPWPLWSSIQLRTSYHIICPGEYDLPSFPIASPSWSARQRIHRTGLSRAVHPPTGLCLSLEAALLIFAQKLDCYYHLLAPLALLHSNMFLETRPTTRMDGINFRRAQLESPCEIKGLVEPSPLIDFHMLPPELWILVARMVSLFRISPFLSWNCNDKSSHSG